MNKILLHSPMLQIESMRTCSMLSKAESRVGSIMPKKSLPNYCTHVGGQFTTQYHPVHLQVITPKWKNMFLKILSIDRIFLITAMKFFVHLAKLLIGDMGIDLCRCDIGVTKHHLHRTDIRAIREEICRE